jgi:hypothetical protein
MKKIDKKAYAEPRHDKSHLQTVAVIALLVATLLIVGGIVLFVNGCQASGVWTKIWKIILGLAFVVPGVPVGIAGIMMLITASSMINVKDGSVADVGNSAMGTVNVLKCNKCGEKLDEDSTFCTKCGTEVEGLVKCECGCVNNVEDKYCKKCGLPLKK